MLQGAIVCYSFSPYPWDIHFSSSQAILRRRVNISIWAAAPLLHFVPILRPSERLLFHPPATPRCVCVSGCQSHRSHVKLWLLFVPEPVNQWDPSDCRRADMSITNMSVHMSLFTLTLLYSPLIWNSHARMPHSYSGSPRGANGFPFVALVPFVFLVVVKREQTTVSVLVSSLYSHEEE